MEYEADTKHVEELIKAQGLDEDSNPAAGPAIKWKEEDEALKAEELDSREEQKAFRASAARMNYLGLDRPDIQYATKELCQGMAAPSRMGQALMKRATRYLIGVPRLVWWFGEVDEEEQSEEIEVFVDSDWAGARDRKSTSGGMVLMGGVAVKSWSRTQKVRALSSGEAEFYAIVSGVAEGLGMVTLAADLGWRARVLLWTDSNAGRAICSRKGLGKLRHLETKWLWVQDVVRSGRIRVRKVGGTSNPADILTKPKSGKDMDGMIRRIGGRLLWRRKGRSVEDEEGSRMEEIGWTGFQRGHTGSVACQ